MNTKRYAFQTLVCRFVFRQFGGIVFKKFFYYGEKGRKIGIVRFFMDFMILYFER